MRKRIGKRRLEKGGAGGPVGLSCPAFCSIDAKAAQTEIWTAFLLCGGSERWLQKGEKEPSFRLKCSLCRFSFQREAAGLIKQVDQEQSAIEQSRCLPGLEKDGTKLF